MTGPISSGNLGWEKKLKVFKNLFWEDLFVFVEIFSTAASKLEQNILKIILRI